MEFKKGDLVTRNSYSNDIIFVIEKIDEDICYLKGKNIRLIADAKKEDLKKYDGKIEEEEIEEVPKLERDDYFFIPGKILHIDADKDYLERSLEYYKNANIWVKGILEKEENIASSIYSLLKEYNPNIVVITGHDAYYKKRGKQDVLSNYKNSKHYVDAIKEARRYEKSHEKLIIIAGGCQSDYEELIKAGANFASSPKRINIHALDPAIIAVKMSTSDINKDIDIKQILNSTKYKTEGIGGIITKGTMYVGYPR